MIARVVIGVMSLAFISGCSSNATNSGIPFRVVDKSGPGVVGGATDKDLNEIQIFAATSQVDLTGLIEGVGDQIPADDICASKPQDAVCQPSRSDALLVAIFVPSGCGVKSDVTGVKLESGSKLVVNTTTSSTLCFSAGSGLQAERPFWLVSIPLSSIPSASVTVISRNTDGKNVTEVVTLADLRRPLPPILDLPARIEEVQNAVKAARSDALRHGIGALLSGITILRWPDSSDGCPNSSQTGPVGAAGYGITFGLADAGGATEYRWRNNVLFRC